MKYSEIDPEKLKIAGNRILVRKKKPIQDDGFEESASGIVVPKTMEGEEKGPDNIAEVVGVGSNIEDCNISQGAFVIMQPYAGIGFPHGDYDYSIISESDVFAVV